MKVALLLLVGVCVLSGRAELQDFDEIFVESPILEKHYPNIELIHPITGNYTKHHLKSHNDFEDDDDVAVDDILYENGFFEINNDDVYDFSFKPKKPQFDGKKGEQKQADETTLDESEEDQDYEEDSVETTPATNQTSSAPATNQTSSNSTTTDNPDLSSEEESSTEAMTNATQIFIHPINRPANQWNLTGTSVSRPNRRPPNRRPRPQANRRPQQFPDFVNKKRRPNPQQSNQRPVNNRRKRPQRIDAAGNDVNNIQNLFASGSCGNCQCGVTTTRRSGSGGAAAINEFPWLALIIYNNTIQCGGVLINDRFVLTATHCIRGFDIEMFEIRFLEPNRSGGNSQTNRKPGRFYSLSSYQSQTANNDVALIRLETPIIFSTSTIRPICLPLNGMDFTGSTATLAGWGSITNNNTESNEVRKTKVPILANSQCLLLGMRITDNMLCSGRILSTAVDTCQGDSGGPLMVILNRRYYLAGLTSWGDGCARDKRPGVYARMTSFVPWVRRMSLGSCWCT